MHTQLSLNDRVAAQVTELLMTQGISFNGYLTPNEAKNTIKTIGIKFMDVHGKKVRFAKKIDGKVRRINLGDLSVFGFIKACQAAFELLNLNDEELMNRIKVASQLKTVHNTVSMLVNSFSSSELQHVEPSTLKGYKTCLNRITKGLGSVNLKQLDHDTVSDWMNECLKTICAKTMKETLFLLKRILNRAHRNRLTDDLRIDFKLLHNNVNAYRVPRCLKAAELLNLHDIDKIMSVGYDTLKQSNLHVIADCIIVGALGLGARIGELRALSYEDISKQSNGKYMIKIQHSIVMEKFKYPKVFNDEFKTVEVFLAANHSLERLMKNSLKYQPICVPIHKQNRVVTTEKINPLAVDPTTHKLYTETRFKTDLNRLLKLSDIDKKFTPRLLRHSYATLSRKAGADVDFISNNITHCNTETTKKHYILTQESDVNVSFEAANARVQEACNDVFGANPKHHRNQDLSA